jgi:GNAT superfamily N-acetyltransferase
MLENNNTNQNLIKIRFATIEDTPLILQFIKDLAEYEKLSSEVSADEDMLKMYLFGQGDTSIDKLRILAECIIAEYNNEPVGFAVFFHNFSTFKGKPGLYLEDLFVKPDIRGKGIGKALLIELAKIAKERNCSRFEWSVLDWNKPAIDFYKSLGAEPMSDWTVFRINENGIDNLLI